MARSIWISTLLLTLWTGFGAEQAWAQSSESRLPRAQRDARWWTGQVESAITERDPALKNLKITRLHYLLSEALRAVVGREAGANFHTWAVWGSTKAGMTIRGKDFEQALQNGSFRGLPGGSRTGRTLAWLAGDRAGGRPAGALSAPLGLLLGRPLIRGIARRHRARATRALLGANELVVRITAHHTIRFLMAFHALERPDAARLAAFLAPFKRGALEVGGEDELRLAYRRYYDARFAADLDQKREAAFEAVIRSMRHEMTQMQPYFRRALPRGLARRMLRYFSTYRVGGLRFDMRRDVPQLGVAPELRELENDALRCLLDSGLRRGGVRADGRGSSIRVLDSRDDRLGYLFTLARGLHTNANVFQAPMSPEQLALIGRCIKPRELA